MKIPSVPRKVLLLLAGLVWSAVGLVLSAVAARWFVMVRQNILIPLLAGLGAGMAAHWLKFSRLSANNIARILAQAPGKDKICLFAFFSWQGYLLVGVMMLLGYTLRHLPIERIYLAPLYLAIGLGLLLSSLTYYRRYAQ